MSLDASNQQQETIYLEVHTVDHAPPSLAPGLTALHSGKLGDIIYALPAMKLKGLTHLILHPIENSGDALLDFPASLARQMIPLLLYQNYIDTVSLVVPRGQHTHEYLLDCRTSNFNRFRQVPRHLLQSWSHLWHPDILRYSHEHKPIHLAQMMSEAVGCQVSLTQPWLQAPTLAQYENKTLLSVTYRWRSLPPSFWKKMTELLDQEELLFMGTLGEQKRAGLLHLQRPEFQNHLELASAIKSAKAFLGTVSFPYSLAEAMKVPRALELCHFNLNVFPMGENGWVLHPHPQSNSKALKQPPFSLSVSPLHLSLTSYIYFQTLGVRLRIKHHLRAVKKKINLFKSRLQKKLSEHKKKGTPSKRVPPVEFKKK